LSDLAEIRETFALFDDWEDKYRFLIDLGKDLGSLPEQAKTEEHLIRGCQSQVWLDTQLDPNQGTLQLAIDSDAHIVRGLGAVVLAALHDKTPSVIVNFDMDSLFNELDLLQHISPTRGNGLRAMVARIQQIAQHHLDSH